jgi:hypothetical protein
MEIPFELFCINEVPLNGRKFHSILYGTVDAILNSFVLKLKGDIHLNTVEGEAGAS